MYIKNPTASEIGINKVIERQIRSIKFYINEGMGKDEAIEIARKESNLASPVWEYISNRI